MISQSRLLQRGLTPSSLPDSILHPACREISRIEDLDRFFSPNHLQSLCNCTAFQKVPSFPQQVRSGLRGSKSPCSSHVRFQTPRNACHYRSSRQGGFSCLYNRITFKECINALPALWCLSVYLVTRQNPQQKPFRV